VLTFVVTNRASYNRIKTIVSNLQNFIVPHFILGSSIFLYKYGDMIKQMSEDFPNTRIHKSVMAVDSDSLVKMPKGIGLGTVEIAGILDNIETDGVVTIADRFETMATAISASCMNIPLFHIQGGETSGTIDNKIRNAITQLSDYHFPATHKAADRICRMNSCASKFFNVFPYGCPSMDLLDVDNRDRKYIIEEINNTGNGDLLDYEKKYMIVILHQDTINPISPDQLLDFHKALEYIDIQKIIFWNNIDPGGDKISKLWRLDQRIDKYNNTRYIRHINPELMGALLRNSEGIVGNSSTGIREATFLGIPSMTVGYRQMNRECGTTIAHVYDFSLDRMVEVMNDFKTVARKRNYRYGYGDAGKKIANAIGDILCR
jgi:UDP-hydrolysing UDP-N-acetyl-D-glucosamine 2-epimerase